MKVQIDHPNGIKDKVFLEGQTTVPKEISNVVGEIQDNTYKRI